MKKILFGVVAALIIAGISAYAFRAPLVAAVSSQLTADMFVAADDDPFDAGPLIGSRLPAILASHEGAPITSLESLMGTRGLLLFANRSVEW